jgi:hypothetical protein
MANWVLWNSPPIPSEVFEHDDSPWQVRLKVDELSIEDSPSRSDIASLFHLYNDATARERDAIDAAFVWMTGYTFASICAMAVTPKGKDFEATLEKWRKPKS